MAEQIIAEIANCVLVGNSKKITDLVSHALQSGMKPDVILKEGLMTGMELVRDKVKREEYYIPHVLLAERARQEAMAIIKEPLEAVGFEPLATIVVGTVKEDLHDIGKNLVAAMLEGQGFKIIDLTVDVKPEQFLEAAQSHQADVVGMSALLTTTMDNMRTTVELLRDQGFTGKIIIGGAPVTQEFATQINADLFAEDAASAVEVLKTALNVA